MGNSKFAQAQYLIECGLSLLPKDKKKKLHATFYMCWGKVYYELLRYCSNLLKAKADINKELEEQMNAKTVLFNEISTEYTNLKIAKNYDEVKTIFRIGNTQYKKALAYFVLDGFVTEHVTIILDINGMYKILQGLEETKSKQFGIAERRQELIEPIVKAINPKAYIGL